MELNGTAVVPTLTPVAAPLATVPGTTRTGSVDDHSAHLRRSSSTTPAHAPLDHFYRERTRGPPTRHGIAAFDAATGSRISAIASEYLPSNSGMGRHGRGGRESLVDD